ncbi:SHD1 domain-containing protein [Bremerella sp. P1]|uniref:SHD1 domain-containing protein n=1 Tax=Bremerella sp. P1 TaxID=3026424 RepID=UPI0023686ADF|nr:SHD1 domain-containing protein [Bremerella sp. P1]WDI42904.1 SHD1 domain-containing protein [Bremerella sp. P1]
MKHPITSAIAVCACLMASVVVAREWTDITGKFRTEAEYVSFQDGTVELRKPDGNPIKVPLEKLSDDDLKILRDRPEIAAFLEDHPELKKRASDFVHIPAPAGLESGVVCRFKRIDHGANSLAFSPNGRFLAAGRGNNGIDMFDLTVGNRVSQANDVSDLSHVDICQFTPNGKRLVATGGYDGVIHVWDVSPGGELKPKQRLVGHGREVSCLAISSNSVRAVSGDHYGRLIYWELDSGRKLSDLTKFTTKVLACCITPNGQQAVATDGREVKLFDLPSSTEIESIKLGSFGSSDVLFSPLCRLLVTYSTANIDIREIATGEGTRIKIYGTKYDTKISPNESELFTFESKFIRRWDVATGELISQIDPTIPAGPLVSAISPDGRHIAVTRMGFYKELVVIRLADK